MSAGTPAGDPPASAPTLDAWRASLAPGLVAACAEAWALELGPAYPHAYVSVVHEARSREHGDVVLKVGFPHREAEREADALAAWAGDGAVRLLARDDARHALLLERCSPGTPLATAPAAEALDVLAALLPRLLVPAPPRVRALEEEAAWWAGLLPGQWERAGRPFERALLDEALDALRELPPTQPESVLLHQDLHPGNVLRAARGPWLAIDPKPLAGERAFAAAPVVRSSGSGWAPGEAGRRLDRVCAAVGLDRERARRWALAQTVAWSFAGPAVLHEHVAVARALARGGAVRRRARRAPPPRA